MPGVVCGEYLTPLADEFLHFGCPDLLEAPADFVTHSGESEEFAEQETLAGVVRARCHDRPLGGDRLLEAGFLEQLGRRHAIMIRPVRYGTRRHHRL
jgi:hypothetical protein